MLLKLKLERFKNTLCTTTTTTITFRLAPDLTPGPPAFQQTRGYG